jgi:hypothetical protein
VAAAPFLAVLKFAAKGETFNYPCTISDVNAAFYIFPDGNSDVVLPSNKGPLALVDVVLSAAGTDTRTATIWVNGKNTGEVVLNAGNIGTNVARQFVGSPLLIAPASRLRFIQVT